MSFVTSISLSSSVSPLRVVVHADESCLGNGREPPNPGGAGCLIEVARSGRTTERRDFWISAPDTTNNRMALEGAIRCFEGFARTGRTVSVTYVSDSQYLVKGMREWMPAWKVRGWTRKGGAIENLDLWQALDQLVAPHPVTWTWVRGHAGHPKNEFADRLAVRAAREQSQSEGFVASQFDAWLAEQRLKGRFLEYDPDAEF